MVSMKQKAGPAAIAVAAVVIIVLLFFMYRYFFPPQPPNDTDNAKGMPVYAQKWIEQHKQGQPSANRSGYPGTSAQPEASSQGGGGK